MVLTVILASLLVAGSVATVSATETFSCDNWCINIVWTSDHVLSKTYDNFTFAVSFGGVVMNNATNNASKFAFSIVDVAEDGYLVEIYKGADAGADYLYKDNSVKLLTCGAESVLLYDGANVDASSVEVVQRVNLLEFYIDNVKVYQKTVTPIVANEFRHFTNDVANPNDFEDISLPSCFTGYFYTSISESGSGSSFDTGQMTSISTSIVTLVVGILPFMIVLAVVKMIPRMLKGVKL